MEVADLTAAIEQLDDDLDDLEAALAPLIKTALSDTAGKLPLLDRAKLYALATYMIESVLFSFVRLNGSNAKDHPVFRELARVKQYFEKIKDIEFGGRKRENMTLDKPAVGRMLKHALAGNTQLDRIRVQQQAKDNAMVHQLLSLPYKKRKASISISASPDPENTKSSTPEIGAHTVRFDDFKDQEIQDSDHVSLTPKKKRCQRRQSKSSSG